MYTNFKRIVSILCSVALLCSFGLTAFATEAPVKTDISITTLDPANGVVEFAGVADGDDVSVDFDEITMELYKGDELGFSTEVVKANVCDFTDNEALVYDSYSVDYDDNGTIKIVAKNLKPHKNANENVAFWIGFAVKAPEGAAKFNYMLAGRSYSDGTDIDLETIDSEGTKGVAFYFDAQYPASYVELQWLDESGNALTKWEYAFIDTDAVELYTVNAEVTKANVCDSVFPEAEIYTSYNVSENEGTVKISMTGLKPHKNADEEVAFWTGFALEAPEGAEKFDYSIWAPYEYDDYYFADHVSSGSDIALEDIDSEGTKGVAFYLNTEGFYYTEDGELFAEVNLTWCDADGNPIAATNSYTVDLTDVGLYTIEDTFTEAVVRDNSNPDSETPVYADGTYNVAYNKNSHTVAISMDALKLHKNANDEIGFWTGFAIPAPEGAAKFDYNIRSRSGYVSSDYNVNLETIDAEGTEGVAFYFDANDYWYYNSDKALAFVNLTWCDADGNPIAATNNYTVDLTDVECDWLEDSEIGLANVADFDSEDEVYTEGSYTVSADYDSVKIAMKGLKKHTNGNLDEGYWTGFSVKAPDGAKYYSYSFEGPESASSAEFEALGEDEDSVSFYIDAGDINAKNSLYIEWYSDDETPYTLIDKYLYPIDITGVELADVAPITAEAATIECCETPGKVLFAEESYTAEIDGAKIKFSADNLKAHVNGEGDRGAWVGVKFVAPENAETAKYVFASDMEDAMYDWLYEDASTIPADEASFYVNAFEPADELKDVILFQWFDENGYALSNFGAYELDLSDVDFEVSDAAMTVEPAPIVDQDDPETSTYYGEAVAELKNNVITVSADYIFEHNSDGAGYGCWLGFIGKVEGAKYLRYAFYDSDNYYPVLWHDATEIEVDGQESFYVDASDPKDTLKLQWFDENGDALTNVNTYTIAVYDSKYNDEDSFGVLFSNIKLTGANADKYNLVYDGFYPISDSEYVDWMSTKDYVYADVQSWDEDSTVSYDGERYNVFFRDKDYNDGIDTVQITATRTGGYTVEGWYDYYSDTKISSNTSFNASLDECYDLYVTFKKKTVVGGALSAGGSTDNNTDDESDTPEEQPNQTVPSTGLTFTDLSENAWYYADVKAAVEKGLMNGVSSTKFDPTSNLTRAMFVTILYRVAGEPGITAYADFTDVPTSQYYASAVAWASANGIVNGVSEDKFAPNANITREQMAAIIYRYGTAAGITPASDNDINYTDADEISDYAKDAAKWTYNAGIILGNADGSFAPARTATRAEAATIFVRLLALIK